MFKQVVEDSQRLDRVYRALGDPTRRRLLEALGQGEARITDLAAPIPLTFAAVARHIAALEHAGLISREVRGREHWLSIRPDGIREAQDWIAQHSDAWARRADALVAHLQQRNRT
jgi:DNA-binding transcriptional ArsR family regulator